MTTPRDKACEVQCDCSTIFSSFLSKNVHNVAKLTENCQLYYLAMHVRTLAVPAVPISVRGTPKGSNPQWTAPTAATSRTSEMPRRLRKGRSG